MYSEAQARPVARVRHKCGGVGASGLAEVNKQGDTLVIAHTLKKQIEPILN
eukprot:SAG11_NODE_25302_length_360_cov_2.727969_1_plen_51_part_00